jgi:hypothetical protein
MLDAEERTFFCTETRSPPLSFFQTIGKPGEEHVRLAIHVTPPPNSQYPEGEGAVPSRKFMRRSREDPWSNTGEGSARR